MRTLQSLAALVATLLTCGITAGSPALASGPGTLKFDQSSVEVLEEAGVAVVVVERSQGDDGAVSVDFTSADGSATAGSDYSPAAGTLTWGSGDGSNRTITVPILDDADSEGSETIELALLAATGGATIDPLRGTALVRILASDGGTGGGDDDDDDDDDGDDDDDDDDDDDGDDDDDDDDDGTGAGVLKFDERTFFGLESGGVAMITVERSHGEDGAVSVDFSTADGTAVAGNDYTATSGTLSWAAGDGSTRTFMVPLHDDGVAEGTETVQLALSNPTGGALIDSDRGTAVLMITENEGVPPGDDDDDQPGTFKFAERSFQVIEGQAFALIRVERSHGEAGPVTVDYTASAGSATAGDDFQLVTGTLTWASGDGANKTFQVPIFDDTVSEDSETILLELSAATNGATIDPLRGSALLHLLDNDGSQAACVPDATTLCLLGGRFRVEVTWRIPNSGGDTGDGRAVPLSDKSGLFWFFNENNSEMLLKILDGCGLSGASYWVFYAATTNVDFTLTVSDTASGVVKQYHNPLGLAAEPVQDVSTFRTCGQ